MYEKDGPPLLFVAVWGLFAVAMFCAHTQMAAHGVRLAVPFQYEDAEQPTLMAALD